MRPLVLLGALLPLLSLLGAAKNPAAGRGPRDFEFTRLDRTYRDVAEGAEPVERGSLRIDLSSPHQEISLLRHRLRLVPRADGTHDAELWTRFRGQGRLEARVALSGLGAGQRFQDDLVLPDQAQTLRGRVRIERGRDGYLVTTLELPPETEVRIQSRLAGELLAWCDRMASLPFSPLQCGGLDRALASATVPLPRPGQTYLLADADLTPEDRRGLDAYLGVKGRK
jgi:hypothetical protein